MKMMMVWFGFVLCALSAAGKVFIGEVGKKVTLECGVNININSVSWYKGREKLISVVSSSGIPSKGKDEIVSRSSIRKTGLVISGVKETDTGKFRCEADRQPFEHTLLVVAVSVVPSRDLEEGSQATLKCQVYGMDQSSTVTWEKPDGSASSKQTHELKPVATSDGGTWQCVVNHIEGTYKASLNLKVKASAPKTTAPSNTPNSKIIKTHGRDINGNSSTGTVKHLGLEWWIWAALGAGCLVLIFLIIFIIVMCKRVKKKKRKLQTMRHAQQSHRSKKYCQCARQTAAAKPQQGRRNEKPSALTIQPLLTQ